MAYNWMNRGRGFRCKGKCGKQYGADVSRAWEAEKKIGPVCQECAVADGAVSDDKPMPQMSAGSAVEIDLSNVTSALGDMEELITEIGNGVANIDGRVLDMHMALNSCVEGINETNALLRDLIKLVTPQAAPIDMTPPKGKPDEPKPPVDMSVFKWQPPKQVARPARPNEMHIFDQPDEIPKL